MHVLPLHIRTDCTCIGLQVASPCINHPAPHNFVTVFQPRTLCRYFTVIFESFTQRLHITHFIVILQRNHHITQLNFLVWTSISWKCNTSCFYVHLWVLQSARQFREKSQSFLVNFAEIKLNFANATLMSLLGLCT